MELHRLIAQVVSDHHQNPYSLKSYHSLCDYINKSRAPAPVAFWRVKGFSEALSPQDVKAWEDQIDVEFPSETDRAREKTALYSLLVGQLPIAAYKAAYLDHYKKCTDIDNTLPSWESMAATFYHDSAADFCHSQLLFDRLVISLYDDDAAILSLYEQRIGVPHKQLNETYSQLSSLVSRLFPNEYTTRMRQYSQAMTKTQRSQRYYEKFEFDIASDCGNPVKWAEYMQQVHKYEPSNFLLILYNSLHYSGKFRKNDDTWLSIWSAAISMAGLLSSKGMDSLLDLYLKMYPSRREPYRELLYANGENFANVKQRISEEKLSSDSVLIKDILTVTAQKMRTGECHDDDFWSYCSLLDDADGMRFALYLLSNDSHWVKKITEFFTSKYPHNAEIWYVSFSCLSEEDKTKFMENCVSSGSKEYLKLDKPELFLDMMKANFGSRGVGNLHEVQSFLRQAYLELEAERGAETKPAQVKRNAEELEDESTEMAPKAEAMQEHIPSESKKMKTQPAAAEHHRSREQFRIKLSPVNHASNEDIETFFKDCATPLSIVWGEDPDNVSFAIVELATEEDVLVCLSRHLKPLLGCPVKIERIHGNTVWMTNYPPEYSTLELGNMVKQVSGFSPISIRVPSQRDGSERRFSYMDFPDSSIALRVANMLSNEEVDGYKLHAEVSNPSLRKSKSHNAALQVYLRNLNFKVSNEESIREFAEKFGPVESVNVPLSDANKEKGQKNNGYAFVTFSSEVSRQQALDLQSAEIDGRQVAISAVNTKAQHQKQASHFDTSSTITIKGVDEHMTAEQLRKFIEEKVGCVARIQLKPSKGMALVEFETVKDSGKAEFILQGTKLESGTLKVGPKKDFFDTEQTVSVPKMMPPSLLRRKRR